MVGPPAAKEEQSSFFKRILAVSGADDPRGPVNFFAQINKAARDHYPPDTGSVFKHGKTLS